MNRFGKIILLLCLLCAAGCMSLEQSTLPATQKKNYEFSSYDLAPPQSLQWRFLAFNKELQNVGFIHSEHYSRIFFWVTPLLKEYSEKETAENIVDYFQNKTLKEFKLSPDIKLSEQSIAQTKKTIHGHEFIVLSIKYSVEKSDYGVDFYYLVNKPNQLIYNMAIWKTIKKYKDPNWQENLQKDFEDIVSKIVFKTPDKKDIVSLRVDYAVSDFNERLDKRYVKEEVEKLNERRNIALQEIQSWAQMKKDNYRAYYLLGDMSLFNDKFEKYGEGFNKQQAVDYFQRSLSIRKYFKPSYVGLAELYKATGENDKAIENYEMAINISPNDDSLYSKIGEIYEKKGDKVKAKQYYEKAIRYWSSGFTTRDELKNKIKNW